MSGHRPKAIQSTPAHSRSSVSELPARSEAVVVGGGVVGLSVAYELARRGREVLVLDRDDAPGVATRAAAGMLAPTSEADLSRPGSRRARARQPRALSGFVAGIEGLSGQACGYRTEGTLWVALNRDQDGDLERLFAMQRAKGLAARRLTAEEALAREPHLSGRIVAALLAEGDHQVDPRALAQALGGGARADSGGAWSWLPGDPDRGARGEVEAVSGMVGDAPSACAAEVVVLAGGVWSEDVAGPVPELGLRPVKGQLVRLAGPELVRHVVRSPDVYLVPRRGGELLVGATMEEQGFDALPRAGAVLDLLREAWRLLPGHRRPGRGRAVGRLPAGAARSPAGDRAGPRRGGSTSPPDTSATGCSSRPPRPTTWRSGS